MDRSWKAPKCEVPEVPDYVKAVTTNRDLETIFYMEGARVAVTLKKR
jgi:hypothetical protein